MVDTSIVAELKSKPAVHKFGGSSLSDSTHINQVIETIQSQVKDHDVVVVSANGGVTDLLIAVIENKTRFLSELKTYMVELIESVLSLPDAMLTVFNRDYQWLQKRLEKTQYNHHDIMALGELWSAQLLSAKLHELGIKNCWYDARAFLSVDNQNNLINPKQARKAWQAITSQGIQLVTGFLATDAVGKSITLGRNGSDYTATLMASLLGSHSVYLWTDVDGVYTADPNVIKQAKRIDVLSICEAQALSELGSHVLHQKTIAPILHKQIKMVINTCHSHTKGTDVVPGEHLIQHNNYQVTTLAHKPNLVQITMEDINELKARQFQTELTAAQINNYANHFDKTQNKLRFYVEQNDWFRATQLIKAVGLSVSKQLAEVSLVSAVGQNIRQNHRLISKLLNRSAKFEVVDIHYPANDHTLCILLAKGQDISLLKDLHETCFGLEPSMPIVVLGYGNIGKQFVNILKQNKQVIEQRVKQSLSLVALANSRYYQVTEGCLLDEVVDLNLPNTAGELFDVLKQYQSKPLVVVDLTASETVASQYQQMAASGWHLISANKLAAANAKQAVQIEQELHKYQRKWLKNTTVGAALPIQQSLHKLLESGDQVTQVSGVFSGSLSWLFGRYDGNKPFLQWVKQAHENAYTEPDPREDLSGQDVYRKALILAREIGFKTKQVNFKPVIPENFLAGSLTAFWQREQAIEAWIKPLWLQAKNQGQSLRYLATITADELRVELQAVDSTHAAASLKPGDNIFIVETLWYQDNPLVIQGPGAGREVTAAGVLNDLIEVLQS